MKISANPLILLLDFLKVKHTKFYSEKLFQEHPNKNNLLGLSQMLSEYSIENNGIRVDDKNSFDISAIEPPFIAAIGNGLGVVSKVSSEKITFILNGEKLTIDTDQFRKSWSGVVLLAESSENSIEPNFEANNKKSIWGALKKYLLLSAIAIAFVYFFFTNQIYSRLGLVLSIAVNLSGVYISYLLVLKQLHVQSKNADKLCNLFKESDCNNILESDAAKLFGVIGWSEIGLGYFISNIVILVLIPSLIPYLALINILALPYSFWSVWYQKFKAKQWCPLCLIVQLLLWLIFVVNLIFGYIYIPGFALSEILVVGLVYVIPILSISILLSLISESKKGQMLAYELNNLKTSEEIFTALLKNQPYHKAELHDSQIIFGNPDAETRITIFSNPHCNPCANMHKRVDKLLRDLGNEICVQYIFCSFSKELESSAKYLIAIYLNNERNAAAEAYNEWFESGIYNNNEYFSKYGQDIDNATIEEEYAKHDRWGDDNMLSGTPTILINGYILPNIYKIEDIKFFTDIKVDVQQQ